METISEEADVQFPQARRATRDSRHAMHSIESGYQRRTSDATGASHPGGAAVLDEHSRQLLEEAEGRRRQAEREVAQVVDGIRRVTARMDSRAKQFAEKMGLGGAYGVGIPSTLVPVRPTQQHRQRAPEQAPPQRRGDFPTARTSVRADREQQAVAHGWKRGAVVMDGLAGTAAAQDQAECGLVEGLPSDELLLENILFCEDAGLSGEELVEMVLQQVALPEGLHRHASAAIHRLISRQ